MTSLEIPFRSHILAIGLVAKVVLLPRVTLGGGKEHG
jgi:hypothetical protein